MRPMSDEEHQQLRRQFDRLLDAHVAAQRCADQIPRKDSFVHYTDIERRSLLRPMRTSNELFTWALNLSDSGDAR